MSILFSPLSIRSVTFRNRLWVSPMCMYSAVDGLVQEWHHSHLAQFASGGAGLIVAEATAVVPEGRISPRDVGLWNDEQRDAWAPIVQAIHDRGAVAGIQLAHAGRKASTDAPWRGGKPLHGEAGWTPVAPSALAFDAGHPVPHMLDARGIDAVVADFRAAARRSAAAGFELIEIHAAHGYLLHEFLSPLCNQRDDDWGGSLANRARLLRRVVGAVRDAWPRPRPLLVRVSATDWSPGGWDIGECVELARWLKQDGVDLVDCSSGGAVPHAKVPVAPGYQVPFAERIRREAGIATGAVGMITDAHQANAIVERGDADLVLLARETLRDPYFARRAAAELGVKIEPPPQYARAW